MKKDLWHNKYFILLLIICMLCLMWFKMWISGQLKLMSNSPRVITSGVTGTMCVSCINYQKFTFSLSIVMKEWGFQYYKESISVLQVCHSTKTKVPSWILNHWMALQSYGEGVLILQGHLGPRLKWPCGTSDRGSFHLLNFLLELLQSTGFVLGNYGANLVG